MPLFARTPNDIPLHAAVFLAMTALWCAASRRLVRHPATGPRLQRTATVLLPFVLIALGLWILSEARQLLA